MNSNVVGHWKMDGTLGAITDASVLPAAIGTNGVIHGTTGTYIAGAISQAMNLTGVNANYADVTTYAAINDLGPMTLMAWIKVPLNTDGGLFYKSDGNSNKGWFFYIDTDYRFYFGVVRATSNIQYKTHNTTALIAGTWAQVVLTWDGVLSASGVHVYVNGAEWGYVGSGYAQDGSGAHNTDAAQNLYLGYKGVGTTISNNFKGGLDEMAIWNRVLTPAEVTYLYNNQKCN